MNPREKENETATKHSPTNCCVYCFGNAVLPWTMSLILFCSFTVFTNKEMLDTMILAAIAKLLAISINSLLARDSKWRHGSFYNIIGWGNGLLSSIKIQAFLIKKIHLKMLPPWGRVTHIYDSISVDDGLWPVRRHPINRTNAGLFLNGPLRTNDTENLINIPRFLLTKRHLKKAATWWRHQMETLSASLALCVGNSLITGESPAQRPVTRNFDVFFDLPLNKRLSNQPRGWWFETPSWSLWRHCNEIGSYFA